MTIKVIDLGSEGMLTGYGDYEHVVWKVVFFGLTGQSLFNGW
jgi:hypothetical protein